MGGWGDRIALARVELSLEPAALIREYLSLGLRFDRIESGYVDAFTGDPALRQSVLAEPAPDPTCYLASTSATDTLKELGWGDAALVWASKTSAIIGAPIEIRPFWDEPGA